MDMIENNIQISRRNSNGIILIIDDNISNIKFIVNHLNHHHFETIIARNGKTGLERARFSQPDLILLDVLMPEMDGFETCRHLMNISLKQGPGSPLTRMEIKQVLWGYQQISPIRHACRRISKKPKKLLKLPIGQKRLFWPI